MARLKKDHSGWKSQGLYLKYKEPTAKKLKKKKNTVKWCRGKIGKKHMLERRFKIHWALSSHEYISNYTETICTSCGKKLYGKYKEVPLQLYIKYKTVNYQIQVKVMSD